MDYEDQYVDNNKENIGILVISYGSRAASMIDALDRSKKYNPCFYIADKVKNPFNVDKAKKTGGKHKKTGMELQNILSFAKKHQEDIDFGIVGPEGPIIEGVRDLIEKETNIEMVCPTSKYALEGSKIRQRKILDEVYPSANPGFKVFRKDDYSDEKSAVSDLRKWTDKVGIEVAVKPDTPAAGKGVGVWGDHFETFEELVDEWFLPNLEDGDIVVEEKVSGEEFSIQFLCDGNQVIPTPPVRDYKRAYDRDLGPNTGGMGSYKDDSNLLPFMEPRDWQEGLDIAQSVFKWFESEDAGDEVRGVPLYLGCVCAEDGVKVFEINNRFGDPECQNILPILKDDFLEVCLKMINGNLDRVRFDEECTVLTYAVPMTYGENRNEFGGDKKVDLSGVYSLKKEKYGDQMRIYEGDLRKKDGDTISGTSRTVSIVGIAESIKEARNISLKGIREIDGPLWNRWDVASDEHIEESIKNMKDLRG